MLPITALLARSATEGLAGSALPDAPVRREPAARVTAPRRALAGTLRSVADRLAPEPVERSRWQSG